VTVDTKELAAALAEPFPADDIGFKPQTTSKDGNKALACAYIDARNVMDRLDAVVGPENWQDDFEVMPNGNVVCRLSLRVGGEWITKTDVGGESDQRDPGDREKAAFSDALKRAAVKWGVGRYLYSLPAVWCEYDPQKKQFMGTPKLPASALPRGSARTAPAPAPAAPKPEPEQIPGRISRVQGAALADALKRQGADPDMLFEEYVITRLGELHDSHFKDALARINRGDFTPTPARQPEAAGVK
jgi:hypothetical protein